MSSPKSNFLKKILIANRGEIAVRVMQTCRRLNIATVAVYSEADRHAKHVAMADEAVCLGSVVLADSYLNIEKIIQAAKDTGADAIHPGYGFLSERATFAKAVVDAGLIFIGAPASAMELMGSKSAAKISMIAANVPCVPGYQDADQSEDVLFDAAKEIGFPVLIKATAGGGGKGMKIVETEAEFLSQLASAKREAKNAFGDDEVILEKYITAPKHIEVQVFADSHGNVVHLFERDCSTQRRYQKIIEEAPAAGLNDATRTDLLNAAVKATQAIDYLGAGTIEFIMDDQDNFYFMEMNTRLQVEHRVTEMITGQDLVEWQIKVAQGEALPLNQMQIRPNGHAIQVRVYAEDADNDYLPSTGLLEQVNLAADSNTLVDSGVRSGDTVSIHYDPMIAKLVVWAEDRNSCIEKTLNVIKQSSIFGVQNNLGFLAKILANRDFKRNEICTNTLDNDALDLSLPLQDEVVAIYAQQAHQLLNNNSQKAWDVKDGWRPTGEESIRLSVNYLGEDHQFNVREEVGQVVVNERTYYLPNADDVCHIHRNLAHVIHNDQRYVLTLPDHEAQASASNSNEIVSPMPGKIIEVMVKPGDEVQIDDTLLVMEAMKMELQLKAEKHAVIDAVNCQAGDQVLADAVLVAFKEDA